MQNVQQRQKPRIRKLLRRMLARAIQANLRNLSRKQRHSEIGGEARVLPRLLFTPEDAVRGEKIMEKKEEFAENVKTAAEMRIPDAPPPVKDELPDAVKKQLIGYAEIELENQLIDCVHAIGSLATVDKLVVALYKRHRREDLDRAKIIRTLNALAADGRIQKQTSPRGYRPAALDETKETSNG